MMKPDIDPEIVFDGKRTPSGSINTRLSSSARENALTQDELTKFGELTPRDTLEKKQN
ncbi:hypothetical protein [Laceyella sacchari]|uniref:Uncharacterized protein n=1 Tax=Laceyella sacchari TaxID=37482 RepID=A0ABY5TY17_LACSH|nr:hypothetical protein [Laceyella sacchari]UWE02317.1 hypothetical protein NYR52_08915 [Laceyella sacchari]